ncbi:Uncharacterised protein [Rhodococcus gordoniae]|uniref:Prevent-host-death protein n=1 Tax=Rhodococcus gordoniae TaxID=223392 RepID=A0A379PSA1_9NOCA|nr:prevent-host-death protein [Rhodococcus gordoniae]SUF08975.1 Uncharacterised protein [Rhodococcus gordoniae]
MSGNHVTFFGDAMSAVAHGIIEIRSLLHRPPVIVGGLAVLSRLSNPYRATVDLDVVDRLHDATPHLEILRAASGAQPVEPAAVLLPTTYGPVKVDVLEVRQIELDQPSDDPGDRLHAAAHAWANDTATDIRIEVISNHGDHIDVTTPVAEPGPLIAMKLQAVMNRSTNKQGTDLLDIVHLTLDPATRPTALAQLHTVDPAIAHDIALHIDLWFTRKRTHSLHRIHTAGGHDITTDDLDLVTELLTDATHR